MSDLSYPRPQFVRDAWLSLDGLWDFATGHAATPTNTHADLAWQRQIRVPFPPEASLSEVGDPGYHPIVWYRRTFHVPAEWRGKRVLLHFGAVDYSAQVWVNGHLVVTHEGGHTPFHTDITDVLEAGTQTVTVRAEDDPQDFGKPRGKQDWQREPHFIWYPRTTGIWQSVWLEPVAPQHIESVRFTPDLPTFSVETDITLANLGLSMAVEPGMVVEVVFKVGDEVLAEDLWVVTRSSAKRTVHLADPGIFDARTPYLWSPEHPTLIEVTLTLRGGERVCDEVRSYTALRSAETRENRFLLNGRPYFLRLVLDQGYWDESHLAAPSAPSGAALRRDVELAKALGFNGVRKHQKVEDPRYLYWADKLGLLVWAELPSALAFSPKSAHRLTREWLEILERDYNHPCVVAWVAFNESWGVPALPTSAAQRHLVEALYHLAKTLGGGRPVVGNDGWEHLSTDLLTLHDYTHDPDMLSARYESSASVAEATRHLWPSGRAVSLREQGDQPVVLSEFGGIRYHPDADGWGYQSVTCAEDLVARYSALVKAASGRGLAGYCYTQFADTFQEKNGLLFSDRTPKGPLEDLRAATLQRGDYQT